ncbi:MAG: hypothetical protein ABL921_06675 [Pirellula sp.]
MRSRAEESSATWLSSKQVAVLAAQNASAAKLVQADSVSRSRSTKLRGQESESKIIGPIQSTISYRTRQTATANALKLHYAIAACLQAQRLLDATAEQLDRQQQAQNQLVDRGVPILDPILIERLMKSREDKELENQSKLATLRRQLALLIGWENACNHSPIESTTLSPTDADVCDHIQAALSCRCDVVILQKLGNSIDEETLDIWDNVGAMLSGLPPVARKVFFVSKFLRWGCKDKDVQSAIEARREWLAALIEERSKQIVSEVEIAFEKKKSAALRWVKTGEHVSLWNRRIAQLEEVGRVRGNLAEQFEAKLNLLQAEGVQIERWLDWHHAEIDLGLAIGCD